MSIANAERNEESSDEVESETIGYGKGIFQLFRRYWFNALVMFTGTSWSIVHQLFTKHIKLALEDVSKQVQGQTVVITGGSRGIGAAITKQCLQLDMNVIIGCRNLTAGQGTVDAIRSQGVHSGSTLVLYLDLSSLSSVRQFAGTLLNQDMPIHYLINNAAIMFSPFQMTQDGFERQFQTNYLSHFLLTTLLKPALHLGGRPDHPSRVVNVSSVAQSGGHVDFDNIDLKKNYSPHLSYMSSKLMQVISTIDLNRRFVEENVNIRVYALHPGVVKTNLYEHVWSARFLGNLANFLYVTQDKGADSVVYAAFSPDVNPNGGCYFSNCKEHPVNPLALDRTVQQKLYEISIELCRRKALSAKEVDMEGGTVVG